MKKIIKEFFANRFNIVLVVLQVIALVFFCLGNVWDIGFIIAIIIEGVFFIVLGIKTFASNKEILKNQTLYESLPMQEGDLEQMKKKNKYRIKSNKFQAVIYIILGIILIFIVLF